MSEEKRTKEEVKADLLIKEAEVLKAKAEINRQEAETRKLNAEAGKAEIEYQKAYVSRQKELATDEENHLYRFNKDVSSMSVQSCMAKLTQWHREDPKCDI